MGNIRTIAWNPIPPVVTLDFGYRSLLSHNLPGHRQVMSLHQVKSEQEYAALGSTSRKVLFFYAGLYGLWHIFLHIFSWYHVMWPVMTSISPLTTDWHQPSQVGGQMHQVFSTLAAKYPNLVFVTIDAEETPALSEQFDVAVVPTFVCVSSDNTVFWRHEGASIRNMLFNLYCTCQCVLTNMRVSWILTYYVILYTCRGESSWIGETCQKRGRW